MINKLEYQLFIGKVSGLIGTEKTIELIEESKLAFKNICNVSNNDFIRKNIEDIDFSARTYNLLKLVKIETIYDILHFRKKDFLKIRNFGNKSIVELEKILTDNNLYFEYNFTEEEKNLYSDIPKKDYSNLFYLR